MIKNTSIHVPQVEIEATPVILRDETMQLRKAKTLLNMKAQGYDALVIYADLEHGGNFEYLTGFLPRFEEALLVLHRDGRAYMVLGNENLNKAQKARLACTPVHMPHFSLPNQPMDTTKTIQEILCETGIKDAQSIGLVGWKNFTNTVDDATCLSDIPTFITQGLASVACKATFKNATSIFIGEDGVRTTNTANEFAHYEYGACIAGTGILKAIDALEVGKKETEIATLLDVDGQMHSVVTIMASGPRFEKANMYPSANTIKRQDPISITTGYKGGLQSRAGFAIASEDELPNGQEDYVQRVAIPYFNAVVTWLKTIRIGMKGHELYDEIQRVYPKETYGWSLNPGHLCADEEWLSSPIYPQSQEILKSGMLFQIDIIPSIQGYAGISCESGILLADEALRHDIETQYPDVWKRIINRRTFMKEELGIVLSEEILPTSIATALCRPCLLDKTSALKVMD